MSYYPVLAYECELGKEVKHGGYSLSSCVDQRVLSTISMLATISNWIPDTAGDRSLDKK